MSSPISDGQQSAEAPSAAVVGSTDGRSKPRPSPAWPSAWLVFYVWCVLSGLVLGLCNGLPLEPHPVMGLLRSLVGLCVGAAWLDAYSRRHRLHPPLDIGFFVGVLSFVVIPYSIYRAEGRRGWRTLALLLAGLALSWLVERGTSVLAGAHLGG